MKTHITGAVAALFTTLASVTFAAAQDQAPYNPDGAQRLMTMARNAECNTHDGYGVSVMAMSAIGLFNTFNVRFGNADYIEDFGYRTFLDVENLANASPQLQAFIIEHECAHHSLGHSYEAYDNGFVPQDRHHQYERDADCEAIRRIAQDYGYSGRGTVSDIFDELAVLNQDIILGLPIDAETQVSMLNALPQRSADRKADGLRCALY